MSDDLVKRLRDLGDHASFEPHMHHTAADRIEELEAKLAQQDDLVQAAVAAALREAAEIYRTLSEGTQVGAGDGQTFHVRYISASEFEAAILALIHKDAQVALDRVVAAEQERCAKVTENRKGNGWDECPPTHPYDKGYVAACDAIAAAIRKGGE